jgi:hypothetical protein
MKKMMAVMVVVVACCAIGAQSASADWYDNGTALNAGQNPTLEVTGTVALSSSGGSLHCNTGTWRFQLTGGTLLSHMLTAGVEEPSKCEVNGGWVFLSGGTTSLKSVTLTGTPEAFNGFGTELAIVNTEMHYVFNNGYKFSVSTIGKGSGVEQAILATPNNTTSISSLALSGELATTKVAAKAKISGTLTVLAPDNGTSGLVS